MLIYQRVNTMISWFHDYHTMVFIHIHKFIDLYSMTHVIIHIIYIYTYIYIHYLQTITKLNKCRVLSFAPKSWVRTNQDLLRSVDRRPLHTCNIMQCKHCIQSSKAILVPMPWTHPLRWRAPAKFENSNGTYLYQEYWFFPANDVSIRNKEFYPCHPVICFRQSAIKHRLLSHPSSLLFLFANVPAAVRVSPIVIDGIGQLIP